MKKRFQIVVSGKVQGVFFRAFTQKKAKSLGLNGFVMNRPDGTVYIDTQGEEETLNQLVAWCWDGSPLSSVTHVEVTQTPNLLEADDFIIKR